MQETPSKPVQCKTENDVTPEKQPTADDDTKGVVKTNSTPLKEVKKTEMEFKTPEKTTNNPKQSSEVNENDTPKKPSTPSESNPNIKENSVPLKELRSAETEFKTPEKSNQADDSTERKVNETPGKTVNSFDLKLEHDGEDGMISTTEQARLLIAASRTPSKSVNRTPIKQNTPSGKRSLENSPVTPGKHRRVELITLASPKAKRIKQM